MAGKVKCRHCGQLLRKTNVVGGGVSADGGWMHLVSRLWFCYRGGVLNRAEHAEPEGG